MSSPELVAGTLTGVWGQGSANDAQGRRPVPLHGRQRTGYQSPQGGPPRGVLPETTCPENRLWNDPHPPHRTMIRQPSRPWLAGVAITANGFAPAGLGRDKGKALGGSRDSDGHPGSDPEDLLGHAAPTRVALKAISRQNFGCI